MALYNLAGKNIQISINGVDLSGMVTDVELTRDYDYRDVTAFGDSGRVYAQGLATDNFTIKGIITPNTERKMASIGYNTTGFETSYATNTTNPPLSDRAKKFYRDGGKPVRMKRSLMNKVPWDSLKVILIGTNDEGYLEYAKSLEEKRALAFGPFERLLVAWPGTYSQDLFEIRGRRDVTELRKRLGLKPRSETTFTDEEGEEWSAC